MWCCFLYSKSDSTIFESVNKILKCDQVMKATECYFPVVLFLFNTVQKTEFKSLNLHLFFFWNVDIFGRNRSFWNRKHEIHGEYNYSLVCLRTIGHLWVVWDLITKARLSAKFFMWKLVVFFFLKASWKWLIITYSNIFWDSKKRSLYFGPQTCYHIGSFV